MTERSREIKEHIAEVKDSTVHVILESNNGNSISVLDLKSKHNMVFDISQALASKSVYGSLTAGDSLNVVAANGSNIAKSVVDVTDLIGRWLYKNDRHERKGFELSKHEIMSSINDGDICYCSWRLVNNTLFFYYVGVQQVAQSMNDYQVDTARIVSLARQRIVLSFRDTTLVCVRDANRPLKMKDLKRMKN